MKKYAFSFSNEMKQNGDEYNLLLTTAYGPYNSEKEAILEAMEMCEYYGYEFTHLVVGQTEYFTPRIDAESVLEDLAQLADDNGYKEDGYLENVKSEHISELDEILTKAYLTWEKKHPEYRNDSYLMTNTVRYSISDLKEEMENKRKGE